MLNKRVLDKGRSTGLGHSWARISVTHRDRRPTPPWQSRHLPPRQPQRAAGHVGRGPRPCALAPGAALGPPPLSRHAGGPCAAAPHGAEPRAQPGPPAPRRVGPPRRVRLLRCAPRYSHACQGRTDQSGELGGAGRLRKERARRRAREMKQRALPRAAVWGAGDAARAHAPPRRPSPPRHSASGCKDRSRSETATGLVLARRSRSRQPGTEPPSVRPSCAAGPVDSSARGGVGGPARAG